MAAVVKQQTATAAAAELLQLGEGVPRTTGKNRGMHKPD